MTPPVEAVAATPTENAPALPVMASVTFNRMKLLEVASDGKARDRDAALRFEGDALSLVDGGATLETIPYRDVLAVFHSHSKEPRWTLPDGSSAPIVKVGGKFSFFKGTPDWVTVRTKKGFTPLRVSDDDLRRVLTELEARTGTKVVRAK